jgi:hypothetical protein
MAYQGQLEPIEILQHQLTWIYCKVLIFEINLAYYLCPWCALPAQAEILYENLLIIHECAQSNVLELLLWLDSSTIVTTHMVTFRNKTERISKNKVARNLNSRYPVSIIQLISGKESKKFLNKVGLSNSN